MVFQLYFKFYFALLGLAMPADLMMPTEISPENFVQIDF